MLTTKFFPICMLILAIAFVSCSKDDVAPLPETPDVEDPVNNTQYAEVINGSNQVVGEARLTRTANGIQAYLESNDLIEDHTYTVWWVIWNKPENCEGSPCEDPDFANPVEVDVLFATGKVVGRDGKGVFSASLNEGNDSGSINEEFGLPPAGGLQNAKKAEVHLVLRSHGPKIPGQVHEQITTYGGGCVSEIEPFTVPPLNPGECSDIEFAVFLPLESE